MLSVFKKAAFAVAILGASNAALAGQDFTVSTLLDDPINGFEWTADRLSGSYVEAVEFTQDLSGAVTFQADIFLPLTAAQLDGVDLSPFALGLGIGGDYSLYSIISFTGAIGSTGAGFIGSNFSGALSVFFDPEADSAGATTSTVQASGIPRLAGGVTPTYDMAQNLVTAGTGTGSDDFLLATANVVGGQATIASASGGFSINGDAFALTSEGEQFFVAPDPFFVELVSSGNLGNDVSAIFFDAINDLFLTGDDQRVVVARQADVVFVPEPSSVALLGLGLLGAGFMSRRKKA